MPEEAWLDDVMARHPVDVPDRESLRLTVQYAAQESWLDSQLDAAPPDMDADLPVRIKARLREALNESPAPERPAIIRFPSGWWLPLSACAAAAALVLLTVFALRPTPDEGASPLPLLSPLATEDTEAAPNELTDWEWNAGDDHVMLAVFDEGADEFAASLDEIDAELASLERAMDSDMWLEQTERLPDALLQELVDESSS